MWIVKALNNCGWQVIPRTNNLLLVSQRWKATAAALATESSSHNETAALNDTDSNDEWEKAKPFDEIPGYRSYPVLGTMWSMFPVIGTGFGVTRNLDHARISIKKFGPFWKDSFPGFPCLVTTARPEDAEKLFQKEGKFPERPTLSTLIKYRADRKENYTTSGILMSKGEPWYKIRSKIQQPLLKPKNMENYIPALGGIADEFVDRIRLIRQKNNEMKPDFVNEFYRWALESVGIVALDTKLDCLNPNLSPDSEAQKMIEATTTSFESFAKLEFGIPLWKYFNTPTLKKLYAAHDFFTDTAIKYISRAVEKIEKRPADSEESISILEELFIRGLTPKDAIVMIVDMLMAGIDTTSHSTSFLIYLLAKNPAQQEKLRKEILSVVGPKGSPVTASHLRDLHYLRACVKETMRMLPAVQGNGRIIDKDMVLSGYRVPKGTMLIVHHQLMGEMEEYFPRPKEFIPERWIKGDPLESHHHPYTLLPFGFGTRMCVGRRLAEMEMWQFTTKALQNFRIEYHYEDIRPLSRFVNSPDQPLRFKFIDLQ